MSMFEIVDNEPQTAIIKVMGVGGGGGNAIKNMMLAGIEGVEFICANTDSQALANCGVRTVLQLGPNITKGLGAGANPEVGREAALEDRERIQEVIEGTDMLFLTAGMGGGTGTGAVPVVAQIAREMGILTVAVVTKPFPFEGKKRMAYAEQGIEQLGQYVDSLITVPNAKLLGVMGKSSSLLDVFKSADDVLRGACQGIAELITREGLINVDFADVRTVMKQMGAAMMGSAVASGGDRAQEAAAAAVSSPLLEDVNLHGAHGILVNITAGMDLTIEEFETIGNTVREFAAEEAIIVVGTVIDPEMDGELRVTVVATGLDRPVKEDSEPEPTLRVVRRSPLQQPAAEEELETAELASNYQRVSGSDLDYLDVPAFLRRQAD